MGLAGWSPKNCFTGLSWEKENISGKRKKTKGKGQYFWEKDNTLGKTKSFLGKEKYSWENENIPGKEEYSWEKENKYPSSKNKKNLRLFVFSANTLQNLMENKKNRKNT